MLCTLSQDINKKDLRTFLSLFQLNLLRISTFAVHCGLMISQTIPTLDNYSVTYFIAKDSPTIMYLTGTC
jgi:hypothetical protein